MTTRRRIDLQAEARRLRGIADEARERLAALEQRHSDAQEGCYPGPGPAELEHARRLWEAAEAAADAAARMANKDGELA